MDYSYLNINYNKPNSYEIEDGVYNGIIKTINHYINKNGKPYIGIIVEIIGNNNYHNKDIMMPYYIPNKDDEYLATKVELINNFKNLFYPDIQTSDFVYRCNWQRCIQQIVTFEATTNDKNYKTYKILSVKNKDFCCDPFAD